MNLTSCDNCGVTLDKNKLNFAHKSDCWDEETGAVDESRAEWSSVSRDYVPYVKCPVCGSSILDED